MSNIAFGARSSMPVRVRCAIRETRGDVNGADAAVQEAFAFVEKSGERFWLADWRRVGGQIALKQPTGPGSGGSLLPESDRDRP